jgi:hypothetical protein
MAEVDFASRRQKGVRDSSEIRPSNTEIGNRLLRRRVIGLDHVAVEGEQLTAMRSEVSALAWTRQPGKTRPADIESVGEKAVSDALLLLEQFLD